jgi:hypothetical protein
LFAGKNSKVQRLPGRSMAGAVLYWRKIKKTSDRHFHGFPEA